MNAKVPWIALGAIVLAGTGFLALDGLQYWHDVRFLFVTTQFSFSEILSGQFNPQQAWEPVDLASSSGFYTSKMLHLWLLQRVLSVASGPLVKIRLAIGFSVVTVAIAALGVGRLIRLLSDSDKLGWLGIAAFLLVPVTPYLAGKQLSEITSLCFGVWGLVLALRVIRDRTPRPRLETALAGGFLLAATLARLDILVGFVAFFAGAWVAFEETRHRTLRVGLGTFLVVAVGQVTALLAVGIPLTRYEAYLLAFIHAPARPAVMSVLSIAIFAGATYLLATAAIRSPRMRLRRFLLIWWVATWIPMIALTANFMVEPRYLVHGLVPFTGLIVLGAEAIGNRVGTERRVRFAFAAVILILATNWVAIRLMPTEVDRPALLRAVGEIQAAAPEAAILVPWAYTDANLLYVLLPDEPIYSVYSPRGLDVPEELVQEWHRRFMGWYGGHHIADDETLDALLDTRPVFYLGWHRYPPVEFVMSIAESVGWTGLAERLRGMDLLDHLETSWVRDRADLSFTLEGNEGQYLYFRLARREAEHDTGA